MPTQLDSALLEELEAGKYAFVDAGCGIGGSIRHCEMRFGWRPGLGLDQAEGDLQVARERGCAVAVCDLLSVELPAACVRFASMMDFLEHLPDADSARQVLEKLARAARDFLFIRHPSFDDVEYLAQYGLKFGWTEWAGHPNRMRVDAFRRLFEEMGWSDYRIQPDLPIRDSSHVGIVPASAPSDAYEYDEAVHGPKPRVEFDRVLYGKYDIFLRLNANLGDAEWQRITSMEGWRAVWE